MLNLNMNYPSVPREMKVFLDFCRQLPAGQQYDLLHPPYQPLSRPDQETLGQWLHFSPEDHHITLTPSANGGLSAVLTALRGKMEEIAVEPFTFPGFRQNALYEGYRLRVIRSDEEGMLPEALEDTLKKYPAKLIYMQPTVHNPTCAVMSEERRKKIVDIVRSFEDVYILEDDAYRFLHPSPPPSFLALMPERTIHLYSLSKVHNPMLKSGYAIHPRNLLPDLINIVRMQSSGASLLFVRFGLHLINSGLLTQIMEEKRAVAIRCAETFKEIFKDVPYRTFPGSFHYWLPCKNPGATVQKLLQGNIDISNGELFSLTEDNHYVRVALGTCWDKKELPGALRRIAAEL
ncbi:aminotransferase class I/II-fold pyridoxal phosphate-dependent enzyme [Chitinophaga sp. GCM10012297]|uniref:PLP-dependent aminotransferase family protein n=1 Tax=Chitinophaga chungangae TaxID=2821488 RepID=A0ABS3YC44_9BACT|nr:PLP-dependent aminotransferase family protein [Chitinophaga chungangae]MBO9152257.1 PLP-dependent aminotransferase family protein [Chitinophaga chungangae]